MAQHRAPHRSAGRRRADPTGSRAGAHRRDSARTGGAAGTGLGAIGPGSGRSRGQRLLGLPSAVGAGILVVTAVAATLGPSGAQLPRAGAAAGTSAEASGTATAPGVNRAASSAALDRRERAVSRDSQREARADAADEDLQAATEKQARTRSAALKELAASAEKRAARIARDAWQLPVTPGAYHLTSRFGDCSSLWSHCHTGLDFAAPSGTPIHAVAAGTITEAGYAGAYGNRTVMTLPDGTVLWYAHQTSIAVSVGQSVVAGQVIGSVGSTGNVTGPHVHLEVRPGDGDPVDPYATLVAHGLRP